jgi:hypothetical protein
MKLFYVKHHNDVALYQFHMIMLYVFFILTAGHGGFVQACLLEYEDGYDMEPESVDCVGDVACGTSGYSLDIVINDNLANVFFCDYPYPVVSGL